MLIDSRPEGEVNMERELAKYCSQAVSVQEPLTELTCGSARLVLTLYDEEGGENGNTPTCFYSLFVDGVDVGSVHISAGYTKETFFCGNIGYAVDEGYRGRGYAGLALGMLVPMLHSWGMRCAAICAGASNSASRRVCEKLSAALISTVVLPLGDRLCRQYGENEICIYLWEF